jgi:hypothetical protein
MGKKIPNHTPVPRSTRIAIVRSSDEQPDALECGKSLREWLANILQ